MQEELLRSSASLTERKSVPEKYLTGLNGKERAQRIQEIQIGRKKDVDDPAAYLPFETDFADGKRRATKTSKYTGEFYKLYPNAHTLLEKAQATGVPLDILERVYEEGLAAYRTGHRPGATQGQWAAARVHSFLVKGCTFYFPDHLLAKEAIKRSTKAQNHFANLPRFCDKK